MKFTLLCSVLSWRIGAVLGEEQQLRYGVDVSWPMHHDFVSTNYPWLPHNQDSENVPTPEKYKDMVIQPLGDVQSKYEAYMQSCFDFEESKAPGRGENCYDTEEGRLNIVRDQPQWMRNYTSTGFLKIRAPEHMFQLLKEFWDTNKQNRKLERWSSGNHFVNHWQTPTYMVSVVDEADDEVQDEIWNAAGEIIQDWTGQRLEGVSMYGIRIYNEGSILLPHVDRNPLVSSCIINVDQDLDEPWPLEVIGHDGLAHNVTMEPGDMVLYESHSIIHGRQFPLKGRFMANLFVHYEPIGPLLDGDDDDDNDELDRSNGRQEEEAEEGWKPYILPEAEFSSDYFRNDEEEQFEDFLDDDDDDDEPWDELDDEEDEFYDEEHEGDYFDEEEESFFEEEEEFLEEEDVEFVDKEQEEAWLDQDGEAFFDHKEVLLEQ